MIKISKEANSNYLAKIVELKGVQKHSNADALQTVNIDFQTVVTGMDAKDGDLYVYFPVECSINKDFLSATNSFRDKGKNKDTEKSGFFEDHGRVKAIKLRGEKSCGYIVPLQVVEEYAKTDLKQFVGQEFDYIGDIKMLEKYVPKTSFVNKTKQGNSPQLSRLIEGQVRLHVDTENLRKNIYKISPDDIISVTYKTHGTSWWVGNLLVKRPLTWWEKLLKRWNVNIEDTIYDLVYGSRRVIKNANLEDPKQKDNFFGYDLWEDIKEQVKDSVPKGLTLYGECIGYDKNGKYIQDSYDYGCKGTESKLEIYRITSTNKDGFVTEYTYPQIKEFCEKANLTASHLFFYGYAKDMYTELNISEHWHENFIKNLERDYNDKNCFLCSNRVPEEGIVVRKESLFSCESFKLKSFSFLEAETKALDKGTIDIESDN